MNRSLFIISVLFLIFVANYLSAQPSVERGEYLVRGPAACGTCHTPVAPLTKKKHDRRMGPIKGMELAGQVWMENDNLITAPNITPGGRVASWTNQELKRIIREGIRPDGSVMAPFMPFISTLGFRSLSDNDVESIVLFLRSLPAVGNNLCVGVIHNLPIPQAYGQPVGYVNDIPAANTVEYGEYLAGPVAHCILCHTPKGPEGFMTDTHLGQGGTEFHGYWGLSVAPNITSHPTALGQYTDEEVKKMITQGIHPSGVKMLPPMPYTNYAKMTEDDLNALIAYLRTIPPHPVSE